MIREDHFPLVILSSPLAAFYNVIGCRFTTIPVMIQAAQTHRQAQAHTSGENSSSTYSSTYSSSRPNENEEGILNIHSRVSSIFLHYGKNKNGSTPPSCHSSPHTEWLPQTETALFFVQKRDGHADEFVRGPRQPSIITNNAARWATRCAQFVVR